MSNLTAIEWLENMIKEMINHGGDLGEDLPALMTHIEQAKETEKKQIEDSYNQGYRDGELLEESQKQEGDISNYSDAELYYIQNYKKD